MILKYNCGIIGTTDKHSVHILGSVAGSHFSIYLTSGVAMWLALTNEM